MYHVTSGNIDGAHIIRYDHGRVTISTSRGQKSRATAYSMLSRGERLYLSALLGGESGLSDWLTRPFMRPRDVPKVLRVPEFCYEDDYWPTIGTDYPLIAATYAPPPLD